MFNNLVMYDQHVAQNSLSSIVPDLAIIRTLPWAALLHRGRVGESQNPDISPPKPCSSVSSYR